MDSTLRGWGQCFSTPLILMRCCQTGAVRSREKSRLWAGSVRTFQGNNIRAAAAWTGPKIAGNKRQATITPNSANPASTLAR
jgi:hypothetical protein